MNVTHRAERDPHSSPEVQSVSEQPQTRVSPRHHGALALLSLAHMALEAVNFELLAVSIMQPPGR